MLLNYVPREENLFYVIVSSNVTAVVIFSLNRVHVDCSITGLGPQLYSEVLQLSVIAA